MSDDILSGGQIDNTTSGPVPAQKDDRSRDIILQQKEKQDNDAIGGTSFPPRVQPPPPIPEPARITPLIPDIPSFNFDIVQSASVDTREIARQATIDVLKNVTINGQGPSIEGSAITFNVPQPPRNTEIAVSQPQPPPTPQTPTIVSGQLPESTAKEPRIENVVSVTLEPPQRGEGTTASRLDAPDFGSAQRTEPERPSRLHAPDFGSAQGNEPERPSRLHAPDFGSAQRDGPERQSRLYAPDFGSAQRDTPVAPSGLSASGSELDVSAFESFGQSESALAYQAASERRKLREEAKDYFGNDLPQREKGESRREYNQRLEELGKQIREEKKKQETEPFSGQRSPVEQNTSGMVPVALMRADKGKKLIAYIATEFAGVYEGAGSGERIMELPSEDSYYIVDVRCAGLNLYTKEGSVWVGAGTVAGLLPTGFDEIQGKIISNGGSGDVWAELNIDNEGSIVSVKVEGGGSTPQNTNDSFYYTLGSYSSNGESLITSNYGCGSLDVTICRNWFAGQPPLYGVSFSRGSGSS